MHYVFYWTTAFGEVNICALRTLFLGLELLADSAHLPVVVGRGLGVGP